MLSKRYPVVSVRTGAAGAITDCKKQYEFINSFEKIYLCFDNDEPGREASRRVAELFPPKKVHIVNLNLKDANEYLIQGKQKDFISRYYEAKTYTPEGIILGENTWDLIANEKVIESIPYPWEGMNSMTYGMRLGELCPKVLCLYMQTNHYTYHSVSQLWKRNVQHGRLPSVQTR